MKKYIGDKHFYRMVLVVVVPIMIQNGITNFVSLLDNIMVGQVGTEQMSGVAIANQLIFVFNLCIFGAVSGAGIFGAQFYGSGVMRESEIRALQAGDFAGTIPYCGTGLHRSRRAADPAVFKW